MQMQVTLSQLHSQAEPAIVGVGSLSYPCCVGTDGVPYSLGTVWQLDFRMRCHQSSACAQWASASWGDTVAGRTKCRSSHERRDSRDLQQSTAHTRQNCNTTLQNDSSSARNDAIDSTPSRGLRVLLMNLVMQSTRLPPLSTD